MSTMMEFFAGNSKTIGEAIEEEEREEADGLHCPGTCALAYVDFSLHLDEKSLDEFSFAVCRCTQTNPVSFWESLGMTVAGDAELPLDAREFSANVVDRSWVETTASVRDEQLNALVQDWVDEINPELSNDQRREVTSKVAELVQMCRLAAGQGTAVVFSWSC